MVPILLSALQGGRIKWDMGWGGGGGAASKDVTSPLNLHIQVQICDVEYQSTKSKVKRKLTFESTLLILSFYSYAPFPPTSTDQSTVSLLPHFLWASVKCVVPKYKGRWGVDTGPPFIYLFGGLSTEVLLKILLASVQRATSSPVALSAIYQSRAFFPPILSSNQELHFL